MSKRTLIVPAALKEGKEAEFEKALKALIKASRQEKGCLFYKVFRISDSRYTFFEEWENGVALARHRAAPHYREFLQTTTPLLEDNLMYIDLEEVEEE